MPETTLAPHWHEALDPEVVAMIHNHPEDKCAQDCLNVISLCDIMLGAISEQHLQGLVTQLRKATVNQCNIYYFG